MDGKTTSINLYSKYIDTLEPFYIYTLSNLRKGEVNKNDVSQMRLHTTNFTQVKPSTAEDDLKFQHIANGDRSEEGEILGFGEMMFYLSCRTHHSKLNDEQMCPKCQSHLRDDQTVEDFKTEIYIELKSNDEEDSPEVIEVVLFRRTVQHLMEKDDIEPLIGARIKIDCNVDEADRLIAVKMTLA